MAFTRDAGQGSRRLLENELFTMANSIEVEADMLLAELAQQGINAFYAAATYSGAGKPTSWVDFSSLGWIANVRSICPVQPAPISAWSREGEWQRS